MTEASAGACALRGIDAAAFVVRHVLDAYAVAGGEGARRLADALSDGGPERLAGDGLAAARAAIGAAAAGRRVGLVVSGDGIVEALPAIREMARLGLPVLLIVPSHGPDVGTTLPAAGPHDIAHLAALPIGILVAADVTQVVDFGLAAERAARDRGAPWVVAFDLAEIGLALSNAVLPDAAVLADWASEAAQPSEGPVIAPPDTDLDAYQRDVDRFAFALGASMRDLERRVRRTLAPLIVDGARDAELVIVATGPSARGARLAMPHMASDAARHVSVMQVASLQPFPAADLVRLAWRARAVLVHEPLPEPLMAGGRLTEAVRASFADALTWHPAFAGIGRIPPVVTVIGGEVGAQDWVRIAHGISPAADPERLVAAQPRVDDGGVAEARLEIAMDPKDRESALRLVVDWLARAGITVVAHAHEATRASIAVKRPANARGPAHVMLVCERADVQTPQLAALPAGAAVVLAGDFPDRVLADTMRAAAPRGIRVATLHAAGGVRAGAAVAGVVGSMLASGARLDAELEAAVRHVGAHDADGLLAQSRTFAESLRAQFS